jgi:hypothetical protein
MTTELIPSIPNELFRDRPHPTHLPRVVGHQPRHRALGIDPIEVDRGMADAVVEGGKVAGQFQRAGGSHGVAHETLRVVQQRAATAPLKTCRRARRFLGVAAAGAGGVRADDVDVRDVQPGPPQRQMYAFRLPLRVGKTKSTASLFMA